MLRRGVLGLALLLSALVAALVSTLARPREAAAFMRPGARSSALARLSGRWVCATGAGVWDVIFTPSGRTIAAQFKAQTADGAELEGIGLVRDDRLFLAMASPEGGIALYRFAGDGGARGEYTTYESQALLGEELLTGGPSGEIAGAYAWIASTPGAAPTPLGTGGQGRLEIERDGEIFRFDWHNRVTGVGLRAGERVVVAWGSSGPHEVAVLAPSDGGLRGVITGDTGKAPLPIVLTPKP